MIVSSPTTHSSKSFILLQFSVLEDNYNFILHNKDTKETIAIDPSDATVTRMHLKARGWSLDHILITHHHADHVGGVNELAETFSAKVWGPSRLKTIGIKINLPLSGEEILSLAGTPIHVIHTPGHTLDHLIYHCSDLDWLFCGDTLFKYGCGRLFEGKPSQMWESLMKISKLPDQTLTFCAHEYTLTNLNFALSLLPDDIQLQLSLAATLHKLSLNEATVPFVLKEQKEDNPFMNPTRYSTQPNQNSESSTLNLFTLFRQKRNNFVSK